MNPTGSSIERGVMCAASFALNQARSTGEAAIKGTSNHDAIEDDIVSGELSKHLVVQRALEGATSVEVEVAYALDVEKETVRRIGVRVGRNYGPLGPNEIALSTDALVRRGEVWVWDWKSRKRVTPALRNLQLRAACVAVMKTEGLSRVHGGIGYLDNDDADVHDFDVFDIPMFFSDMRAMLARIGQARGLVASGQVPEVHAGSWCDYCPAIAYCPAHTRLAMSMLGELDYVEKQVAFMTAEQAGRSWTLLKQIQSLADKVEASLKLRAKQDVVPLPNGKRLALIDCRRSGFDATRAKARLTELGEDLEQFNKVTTYSQVKEINMPAPAGEE